LFDHNRIIKHQVLSLYGISLKKLLCKRLHLDSFFFNLLTFLELRLSSLVFRIFFFRKLLVAIREILKGGILINGNACHKNFLVKCKSLIQYRKVFSNSVVFDSLSLLNKIFVGKWRKYSWWKWRKKRKKIFTFKKRSSFRVIKKKKINTVINYVESNYRTRDSILLYKPVWGEILIVNKKRMLAYSLLNKIYFLY